MFRSYILLFLIFSSLSATTFEWTNTQSSTKKIYTKPFKSFAKQLQADTQKFLKMPKPLDVSQAIPPAVPEPKELQELMNSSEWKVEKSDFETIDMWKERKHKKELELKSKVEKIRYQYHLDFEKRNTIVKKINNILERENELANIAYEKKKFELNTKLSSFAQPIFSEIFGSPILKYINYDINKQMMYMVLVSSKGNYKKNIALDISSYQAEKLHKNFEKIIPSADIEVSLDSTQNITLELVRVRLNYDGTIHYALSSSTEVHTKEILSTTIDKSIFLTNNFLEKNIQVAPNHINKYRSYAIGKVQINDQWFNPNDVLYKRLLQLTPKKTDPKKWLFAITIENYTDGSIDYSLNSGRIIVELFKKKFGISNRHTKAYFDKDATSGIVKDKLRSMLEDIKKDDIIYFYYSGHGVPTNEGDAYILPQDKDPKYMDDDKAYKLENIYKQLSNTKAGHIYVFLDSCFSGRSSKGALDKSIAPALLKHKKATFDRERLTVLTAGTENQFSNSYEKKKHRLFSYFLAKYLLDDISNIEKLYKNIKRDVYDISNDMGDSHRQTPQIDGNLKGELF